jgi:hypothetical protein
VERLHQNGPGYKAGDALRWFEVWRSEDMKGPEVQEWNGRRYVLASVRPEDSLDGNSGRWRLNRVEKGRDPQIGAMVINFELDPAGAALFGNLTAGHVRQPLGIVVDGRLVSAPNITDPITGGKGIITGGGPGGFSDAEADELVRSMGGPFDRSAGGRRALLFCAAAVAVLLVVGIGVIVFVLTRRRRSGPPPVPAG